MENIVLRSLPADAPVDVRACQNNNLVTVFFFKCLPIVILFFGGIMFLDIFLFSKQPLFSQPALLAIVLHPAALQAKRIYAAGSS